VDSWSLTSPNTLKLKKNRERFKGEFLAPECPTLLSCEQFKLMFYGLNKNSANTRRAGSKKSFGMKIFSYFAGAHTQIATAYL